MRKPWSSSVRIEAALGCKVSHRRGPNIIATKSSQATGSATIRCHILSLRTVSSRAGGARRHRLHKSRVFVEQFVDDECFRVVLMLDEELGLDDVDDEAGSMSSSVDEEPEDQ